MATTAMGFPFTVAQWKELERQAMIYKYMMASLPVPPDLLYSSFSSNFYTPSTFAPPSYFLGKYGSGVSLKWGGNSKDTEPGRCRRTDGKKWRCSRDVAPNQKYCERHMHRGRPRSRKHVEQQQQQQQQHSLSNLNFNNNDKDNNAPTTKKTRLTHSSLDHPQCVGTSLQSSSKVSIFHHPLVSNGGSNVFQEQRNLAWTDEQQWSQLVPQTNMNSPVFQNQYELPSTANNGVNFDTWSIAVTGNKNHNENGNKVSMASLNGGNNTNANAIDEELSQIHMGLGLGLIDSWVSTTPTPGGPLAEVLRPGNPAVSGDGEFVTPSATAVSSPSGVLQKTFATFSDSSGSSSPSPTACNNSMTSSEMPFHWLN